MPIQANWKARFLLYLLGPVKVSGLQHSVAILSNRPIGGRYALNEKQGMNLNVQIFIAGCITLLAFFAHTFVGTKESLSTSPRKIADKEKVNNYSVIEKNWIQSMCAFQMITIDLLVLSILLFVIAVTDVITFERVVALLLSGFFLLWGIAWLIQLVALKSSTRNYLHLGQWFFWFLCSGLLYWGAQSL